MYSIIKAAILLCISVFAMKTTFAAENGYIIQERNISCEEPTSVVSACSSSIDYKLPDFSTVPNGTFIPPEPDAIKSLGVLESASKFLINEQCINAGKKYLCEAAHPYRCEKKYVRIDTKKLVATCRQANESCSTSIGATLLKRYLDCSKIENRYGFQQKISRKMTCVNFPTLKDKPCDANYAVFSYNATALNETAKKIVSYHKNLRYIGDPECKKKAAEVICKVWFPACSSDHTKVIALLSKEKCREMVGCLNKTRIFAVIMRAHQICNNLPSNKTATKYSLDNVYQSKSVQTQQAKTTKPNKKSSEIPTSNTTNHAAQLNTSLKGVALLVISIMPIFMGQ